MLSRKDRPADSHSLVLNVWLPLKLVGTIVLRTVASVNHVHIIVSFPYFSGLNPLSHCGPRSLLGLYVILHIIAEVRVNKIVLLNHLHIILKLIALNHIIGVQRRLQKLHLPSALLTAALTSYFAPLSFALDRLLPAHKDLRVDHSFVSVIVLHVFTL